MNVTIEGVGELKALLNRYQDRAVPAMGAALYEEANSIMRDSKAEAPVDTGVLRGSGTVKNPEMSASGVMVEFGYGGAASDYAWIQHERLDYAHSVGNAKYLEGPTLRAANGMGARLAAMVRRIFGV